MSKDVFQLGAGLGTFCLPASLSPSKHAHMQVFQMGKDTTLPLLERSGRWAPRLSSELIKAPVNARCQEWTEKLLVGGIFWSFPCSDFVDESPEASVAMMWASSV